MDTSTPAILQLLPRLMSGGVERGTLEIAEAINAHGWRSFVASEGGIMASSLAKYNTPHLTLPLASKNPWVMWRNATQLVGLIQKHNISILHARSRAPAWSALLAARWAGIPLVTTFHGHYSTHLPFKKFYNSVMVRGEKVIAISDFTAEYIRQQYTAYFPSSRMQVIHRGVDLRLFNPALANRSRLTALAKLWHLPDDKPVILMPARFTRWKGHEVLVDALALLPHRNFICIMTGEEERHPTYIKALDKRILAKNLGENIRRVSATRDMTTAYMLAHLVVVPSQRPEAFGRVAAEAGAMGKPVVGFNHGGLKETVLHGRTGWLAPLGRIEDFSRAIGDFLSMEDDARATLAQTAQTHIAENFSTAQMCAKTLAVYASLLTKQPSTIG